MSVKVLWDQDLKDSNLRINQIMTFVKNVSGQKIENYSSSLQMMLIKTWDMNMSRVIIAVVNLYGEYAFSVLLVKTSIFARVR